MDTILVETESIKAVYHQHLKCFALYDIQNTLIRHIDAQLHLADTYTALSSPCARYLAISSDKSISIIDFEAKKMRIISVIQKGLYWCRFGELLLGILDPLNDRVWLYKGVELVAEISVHGQISATQADIIDDVYIVLSNQKQRQIFRLSVSPNIASVCTKYKLLEDLRSYEVDLRRFDKCIQNFSQVTNNLNVICDAPFNLVELRESASQTMAKMKASIDELTPYLSRILEFEQLAKSAGLIIDRLNCIYENASLICEWLASWDHLKFVTRSWHLLEAISSFDGHLTDFSVLQKSIEVFYENKNFAVFITTSLKQ